ncbi:hypothetical protein A6A04_12080 [Paramagnetospirillum marisnigri]|uniref:protein O-GlcNAc transferase n=1 Tax=Paramagnetospirillum marisnigri TaxID=1285242 RepID=A0A178MW45_9PROT|nr:tetratricopeptide repeat protein [Paramagnetospirillum marisnigri]OAN54656.1 hypothetical protein A6A04_12080 [Paramagnetospirillum marisnigri]
MDDPRHVMAEAIAARQAGDLSASARWAARLAELLPAEPVVRQFQGEVLTELERLDEALAAFEQAVALAPAEAGMHRACAFLAVQCARPDTALVHLEAVAALGQETSDDLANRADALVALGRGQDAIEAYGALLRHRPDSVDALIALSSQLIQARRHAEAEPILRHALTLSPDDGGALTNLALVLLHRGEADEALALARRATERTTPHLAALLARAQAEHRLGHAVAAQNMVDAAERLAPEGNVYIADCAATTLTALGRVDEAILRLRRTLATPQRLPANILSSVTGKLLFCLQYVPDLPAAAMVAEARAWNRLAIGITPLAPAPRSWEPERRLRIGYVSGDFRQHACAFYIEPLLAHHDKSQVEVFCYSDVVVEDSHSQRMRASADHWRRTAGLTDAALAEAICADGIDILVDLAGHTSDNRLFAFAHRPAPIQVATLIGYSATTGVDAMDTLLGDPFLTPMGCEAEFTETVHRLPRIIAPFLPDARWPDPAPEPPERTVFASVADPARLDARTIALWARLLDAVPDSRILAKHNLFDDPEATELWRRRLGELAGRVDIEGIPGGWGRNMGFYGRVTAVLDSPLHSGNTTVLIPLWMGVPVISLPGPNAWQRAGASILSNAGLADLVARDDADYVAIAARLAADRGRQIDLRQSLRPRLRSSPVCDGPLVVGDIEAAYRGLWRQACRRQT